MDQKSREARLGFDLDWDIPLLQSNPVLTATIMPSKQLCGNGRTLCGLS